MIAIADGGRHYEEELGRAEAAAEVERRLSTMGFEKNYRIDPKPDRISPYMDRINLKLDRISPNA